MSKTLDRSDVIIVGAGLAGITTALELIAQGKSVLLLERDHLDAIGGLAKESFGGITMIGTPHQRRMNIPDSPDLAYRDWESFAEFEPSDEWPRKWARFYCDHSLEHIFHYLSGHGVRFLPVVNWPERGLFQPGNSVPRWHITWGTGSEIIARLLAAVDSHPRKSRLRILCQHAVSTLETDQGKVVGVSGTDLADGHEFRALADQVVIAAGGICGGDLSKVRENWYPDWGPPPKHLLNGSHRFADGLLLSPVQAAGGVVTHLDKQWHYAAGIHHPAQRKAHDGLSLLPPRSALWLNAQGKRIGPMPLVGYTDTRHLVESILREPGQYSWLVMNWKIAIKELAASGGDYMTAFRDKSKLRVLGQLLFGNRELVHRLIRECPEDIVVAHSLPELTEKMKSKSLEGISVSANEVKNAIESYDSQIDRGPTFVTDDQLRRIMASRQYRGDRMRLCKYQKIVDAKAMPLIAIRNFILSRKSLGGIQTDLSCRVLNRTGSPVPGLFAVGEAAGFGGGGIHGKRSLEGTFLGACVLTGRIAGKAISEG